MKIIYTSIEDFINEEIKEHGFDYVEAMFAAGNEPTLVSTEHGSFYMWVKLGDKFEHNALDSSYSNSTCDVLPSNRRNVVVGSVSQLTSLAR